MTGVDVPAARVGGNVGALTTTTKSGIATSRSDTDSRQLSGSNARKIRLLVFTSLYPNAAQPRHGVFVEERLRHLVASGRIAATVVAPVPWFPFRHPRFGAYAAFARVPAREERYGIQVEHPRYPVIPKLGMNIAPFLMYRTLLPTIRRLLHEDRGYDLIDAHYLYPDGVAAVSLGQTLGKPVVMTARGNDVTLIPYHRSPRRQILHAVVRTAAVVTVSSTLRKKLIELGAAAESISVLRNGVDLERFKPANANALRAELGVNGSMWLTVGHMIERKGMHLVIEALVHAPEANLLVAGDGPEERHLRSLADRLGVAERVRFLGAIKHDLLCGYYNAADAMLLASSREGMPNVVLESLACGTPVVAAPFESAAELINAPEAGEIAESRTAEAIAAAWQRLHARQPERAATRRFAERLGWAPVVDAQCALYARVLAARKHDVQGAEP